MPHSAAWKSPSNTRRRACSSASQVGHSRRSSIGVLTCSSTSNWRAPSSTQPSSPCNADVDSSRARGRHRRLALRWGCRAVGRLEHHPGARWHRSHVGTRCSSLPQAREVLAAALRNTDRTSTSGCTPSRGVIVSTAVQDALALLAANPVAATDDRDLRAARFDAGLAFVHFDVGHGGRGGDISEHADVEETFSAAGAADWSGRNA